MVEMRKEPGRQYDMSEKMYGHPAIRDAYPIENDISMYTAYDINLKDEEKRQISESIAAFVATLDADAILSQIPDEVLAQVEFKDFMVPGCPEEPDAPLFKMVCCMPKVVDKKLPAILYVPAGGLVSGTAQGLQPMMLDMVLKNQCIVACPEIRCLPDWHYPAPVNDVHAAYDWLYKDPEGLGVDSDNISLAGGSSGAQLALSTGFRLKRYGYRPRGIVALLPITDDRMYLPSSMTTTGTGEWLGDLVKQSSVAYLGPYNSGSPFVGPEAYANHALIEDCAGYPPTFIITFELDPDRDYNREFMEKLLANGVYVEYHMFAGGTHTIMGVQTEEADAYKKPILALLDNAYFQATHFDLRREHGLVRK